MNAEVPSPHTTLVILLGASEWPNFPDLNNDKPEAFVNSARDLEEYFLNPKKFGLPAENLLNLFNSEKNFSDIDNDIGEFLERRTSELKESGRTARDLLVYFVGHGGFTSSDDYYLAIRRTGERNPMSSAILIRSLAFTLKERARFLRRIII